MEFFNSDYYRSCGDEAETPYRRADKSWRFWFPLLSLFSGMRPKEVFQMHVQDLRQTEKGTWYFDIVATSDDDDEQAPQLKKTTKTKGSRRQIPVHPELQQLGFLRFVEDQRKASDDPLLFKGITRGPLMIRPITPFAIFARAIFPKRSTLSPGKAHTVFGTPGATPPAGSTPRRISSRLSGHGAVGNRLPTSMAQNTSLTSTRRTWRRLHSRGLTSLTCT